VQSTVQKVTEQCSRMSTANEDFKIVCDETMGQNKEELDRLNMKIHDKADIRSIQQVYDAQDRMRQYFDDQQRIQKTVQDAMLQKQE